MKKKYLLLLHLLRFLAPMTKNQLFKAALSETILTTDGSQLAFQDV
jgi:hypothetical protein